MRPVSPSHWNLSNFAKERRSPITNGFLYFSKGRGRWCCHSVPMSWNSSCAVSVNVTPTTSGSKLNTTGNVSSTNGGTGNSASATLGAGDFTISVSPTSQTIPPGHMAVYTLTLSSTTGFTGTIGLTCSGGPPNSTCTIVPSSVTLTSGSETAKTTIDLAVPKGASNGTSTLTFTGTSGTLTHSTTASLKVK